MAILLAATRKGLFDLRVQGNQARFATHHFKGEPVSQILVDPRNGHWLAALNLGHFGTKLHTSSDQGQSWKEIAAPAFPAKPETATDDPTPWNVELIWQLAAGGVDEPGTLWAGCIPAGLFKSTDGGASWALNTPLWNQPGRKAWFGGGYDHAGIHSIVVDPRDSNHVTLGISCGGVWQTRDGGQSWMLTAQGMKADYLPADSADDGNTQDPHALVACAAQPDTLWVQHHCGIYQSTDGGVNWQGIAAPSPSGFGFAVAVHPQNPQQAWFVPAQADACRIPVEGRMVVNRTDDGGRSFQSFGEGLPQQNAFHLAYRHGLVVSPDGQTLALGSTTGGLWLGTQLGERWNCVSRDLPPVAALAFAQG